MMMLNFLFKKCLFINKTNFKSFSYQTKRTVSDTKDVRLSSSFVDPAHADLNKPMVFLHGLYGNQNNWRSISYSDAIRARRKSLLIDMRNHGESDHHDSMSYPEMADDVITHLDSLKIDKFTLLGHSMGAKVAMNISTKYKDRLDGLIIVDAAPKDHKENVNIYSNIKAIVEQVSELDIEGKTRKEVLNELKGMFNGPVANLLNVNLTYVSPDSDKVQWRCNLKAIRKNIEKIIGFEVERGDKYRGPLSIILGEKSHIFPLDVYKSLYPNVTEENVSIIKGAGHWVHADKPALVIADIVKFLDKIDNKN